MLQPRRLPGLLLSAALLTPALAGFAGFPAPSANASPQDGGVNIVQRLPATSGLALTSAAPHPDRAPQSLHPNIQTFQQPDPFSGSIAEHLSMNPASTLDVTELLSLGLAMIRCQRLAELPRILESMQLDGVSITASEELEHVCDGFSGALYADVALELLAIAREGDIPALYAAKLLLAHGQGFLSGNQADSGTALREAMEEAQELSRHSLLRGDLSAATMLALEYTTKGTNGFPVADATGRFEQVVDRTYLIKGVGVQQAIYEVSGDNALGIISRHRNIELSEQETLMANEVRDYLIGLWLALDTLHDRANQFGGGGGWSHDSTDPLADFEFDESSE